MTLTINFSRPLVAGGAALLALMFLSWLVYLTLPEAKGEQGPLHKLRAALGMERLPHALILSILALYTALAGILILGLFGLIVDTLRAVGGSNDYLFYVLRIGGLTAVLGAVIALPLTVIRLRLTQDQTETARESLFNDKINEATKGLYARRQVTVGEGAEAKDHWQDDIVQRCAAIDRLEGLAHEKPSEVPRIARLLSVYVRELSVEEPPKDPPKNATPDELRKWASDLPKLRSDMEKAAQILGGLAAIPHSPLQNEEIDLSGANLQNANLNKSLFENVCFSRAKLQGANLQEAKLQGANFTKAHLQGANFSNGQLGGTIFSEAGLQATVFIKSELQNACFENAQMHGVRMTGANLQNADLIDAQMRGATFLASSLSGACLMGARLQGASYLGTEFDSSTQILFTDFSAACFEGIDLTSMTKLDPQIDEFFGDASSTPPNGARPGDTNWPAHWSKEHLEILQFRKAWRAWQATLRLDWDQPD